MEQIDSTLHNDPEICLEAVKAGLSLEFVSESNRKDPVIVMAAILAESDNFKFADQSLKSDKDFILNFLKHKETHEPIIPEVYFIEFAQNLPEALLADKEFALSMIEANPRITTGLNAQLWEDEEINLKTAQQLEKRNATLKMPILKYSHHNLYPYYFKNVSKKTRSDLTIALKLVANFSPYYLMLDANLKKNKNLAFMFLKAERNMPALFNKIPSTLKNDLGFCLEYYLKIQRDITYFPEKIKTIFRYQDTDSILEMVKELELEKVKEQTLKEQVLKEKLLTEQANKEFLKKVKKVNISEQLFKRNIGLNQHNY